MSWWRHQSLSGPEILITQRRLWITLSRGYSFSSARKMLTIRNGVETIGIHTTEKVSSNVTLAFHRNYVSTLHRFWDIARYWSKISAFNLPHLYLAPPLGWPRWNFEILVVRKLEPLGYRTALSAWSYVKPFWYNTDMCQTGRQTDRHTTTAYTALA